MAFKINTDVLEQKIQSARDSYDNITKALDSAKAALDAALTAVGGSSTDIGSALNSVMGNYTEQQYTTAQSVINSMADSVQAVKKTYTDANTDMVSFINKLKTNDGLGGTAGLNTSFDQVQ